MRKSAVFILALGWAVSVMDEEALFVDFVNKHSKFYSTEAELKYRFELFKSAKAKIDDEEASDNLTRGGKILLGNSGKKVRKAFKKRLNGFADLSNQEFSSFYLLPQNILYKPSVSQIRAGRKLAELDVSYHSVAYHISKSNRFLQSSPTERIKGLPQSIDWRNEGIVTPVKSQLKCNSCYAFAAVAAVEAWNKKTKKDEEILSEKDILDCDTENVECKGGQPLAVLEYISKNGIAFEEEYPYRGQKNSSCLAKKSNERKLQWFQQPSKVPGKSQNSFGS